MPQGAKNRPESCLLHRFQPNLVPLRTDPDRLILGSLPFRSTQLAISFAVIPKIDSADPYSWYLVLPHGVRFLGGGLPVVRHCEQLKNFITSTQANILAQVLFLSL